MRSTRVIGYLLPVLGYLLSRVMHDVNAGDHRPAAWMFPIGCLLGAVVCFVSSKEPDGSRSSLLIGYGVLALVVGGGFGAFYIAFDGWMHGF